MPLGRRPRPFSRPDWFFEIKWDGFRSLVRIEHGESKLISRNGNEFKSLSALNDAIATEIRPISRAGWRDRLSRCREYSQWVGREELRLGEQPILNLRTLHWRTAFRIVVNHGVDPVAHGIAAHQPSIAGLQQFGRRSHVSHLRIRFESLSDLLC
jgi:hypothetical protein